MNESTAASSGSAPHSTTFARLASRDWLIPALLGLATIGVFARGLSGEFVGLDDADYVAENPGTMQGLSAEGWRWAWRSVVVGNWHPLTMLSHQMDVSLYGLRPWGHHLTSLLIHAGAVAVAFVLARRWGAGALCATLIAAVWGWHPLRVESVVWIAERKDVLSGLFFFLAVERYTRFAQARDWAAYALAIVFAVLGLLAKPMLVTLPFVLLLVDVWPLGRLSFADAATADGRRRLAARVAEKLPFFVLTAIFIGTTIATQREVIQSSGQPWMTRWQHVALGYFSYLPQMVWPTRMAVYYPRLAQQAISVEALVAAGFLFGATGVAIAQRQRRPYLLVAWLWYLGILVPVIGIVPVGSQARADRFTYLPMFALVVAAAWLIGESPRRGRLGVIAGSFATIACVAISWHQIGYWRNSLELFRHAVEVTGPNVAAEEGLARAYLARGQIDEGLARLDRAIEIQPTYARAYYAKGYALAQVGRRAEAVDALTRAIELGMTLSQVRCDLGDVLILESRYDEAAAEFEQVLASEPRTARAWLGLGQAALGQRKWKTAEEHLGRALELEPGSPAAMERMAWLRATSGDASPREAAETLALARSASSVQGDVNPRALLTRAAAEAQAGDFVAAGFSLLRAREAAAGQNEPLNEADVRAVEQALGARRPVAREE